MAGNYCEYEDKQIISNHRFKRMQGTIAAKSQFFPSRRRKLLFIFCAQGIKYGLGQIDPECVEALGKFKREDGNSKELIYSWEFEGIIEDIDKKIW